MFNQHIDSKLGHPLALSPSSLNLLFICTFFFKRGRGVDAPDLDTPLERVNIYAYSNKSIITP